MNYRLLNQKIVPYLLVFSIFIFFLGKALFTEGIFMDGLLYAAISENLSLGIGSFWKPHLTNTFLTQFYEHPPLAFGFQSIFFRFLGHAFFIEKLYSILTFIVEGYIITKIWKLLYSNYKYCWIPLLFWGIIPAVVWAYSNNMLENTMTIFVSLSVYFYLSYKQRKRQWLFLLISGIFLLWAFLTKGLTSLYPLSMPLWYILFFKEGSLKQMFKEFLFLISGVLVPLMLIFFLSPEAKNFIQQYFKIQVIYSINEVSTVPSRFFIIKRFFSELIPVFILFAILIFTNKGQIGKLNENKSRFKFFLFLSISGVLPIMISLKQSGYYILSVYPFVSIAFASLLYPFLERIEKKITFLFSKRYIRYIPYLFLISSVIWSVSYIGKYSRDEQKICDIKEIIKVVPEGSTISISKNMWPDWALHGYLQRYGKISLDSCKNENIEFLLVSSDNSEKQSGYRQLPLKIKTFKLYKRIY